MRPIRTILYSPHFTRAAKRLPPELISEASEREDLFRRDCFDPRLRTHKLKGKHRDLWSFSITSKYRIMFRFIDADAVYFIDVGDHSIYQ